MLRNFKSMLLIFALMGISNSCLADPPRRVALLIGNWDYNANSRFDTPPTAPVVVPLEPDSGAVGRSSPHPSAARRP